MKKFIIYTLLVICYSCVETPDTPFGGSPTNSVKLENGTLTISWNNVANANSYWLQVCEQDNFENCIFDLGGITETSISVSGLNYGRQYFFRIAASNDQKESGWSSTWHFATLPDIPSLVWPVNGATGVCAILPGLSWTACQGASAYEFYISNNPTFSEDHAGIPDTFMIAHDLARKTTYYWKVGAFCEYGTSYSEVWSFTTDEGQCPGIPTVNYEGKVYNTIQMGDQCWMRENLDVGVQINSSSYSRNNNVVEKYYYNDDPDYGAIYGGLYQWFEAMQYTTIAGSQGICPAGWHIPTREELEVLRQFNHRDDLLAVGQLSGNNSTGFSLLLAGSYSGDNLFSEYPPVNYWSSTESAPLSLDANTLFINEGETAGIGSYSKELGFPVRCIKDK